MAMSNGGQDLRGELFGKQDGAFGPAAGAEIPGAATESQKMLGVTLGAANPGEAPLEPTATQELLYGTDDNRPQGARTRLEAFFVRSDASVEVVFEKVIELHSLRMPGPVFLIRSIMHPAYRIRLIDDALHGLYMHEIAVSNVKLAR